MIVIGDYIIDEYLIGTCRRLSPEAPVPVVENIIKKQFPGGAANVVANLKVLGENPFFIYNKDQITIKTRVVADNHIICRLDEEQYTLYSVPLDFDLSQHSYAVLSDYNKGVLSYAKDIVKRLSDSGIKVLVDPKKSFSQYEGAWLIKANRLEFEKETNQNFSIYDALSSCTELCDKYSFSYIVITLGGEGCYVYDHKEKEHLHIPSDKRNVLDVTGAGDVFLAALAHFVQKCSVFKAAEYANKLASISVSHLGTYTLKESDIATVKPRIVFTNGCFDILHRGHVDLLKKSKKLGEKLIVGLNSDKSVKKLKGNTRPINNQEDRKALLESIDCVDDVIIFDEDTPYELIKKIKPDIITKGGDYEVSTVVGNDLAKVVIIPIIEGYSSTEIINAIKR